MSLFLRLRLINDVAENVAVFFLIFSFFGVPTMLLGSVVQTFIQNEKVNLATKLPFSTSDSSALPRLLGLGLGQIFS